MISKIYFKLTAVIILIKQRLFGLTRAALALKLSDEFRI